MVEIYKTINNVLEKIDEIQPGCWISLIDPTVEDLKFVIEQTNVEADFLNAALDEEETSRVESEPDIQQSLIIIDVPTSQIDNNAKETAVIFSTLPMGIILMQQYIITICVQETPILRDFINGKVRNIETGFKTRFVLNFLLKISARYLQHLKQIDKISNSTEKKLHKSMKNKELIQLLDLEKSLVYFSTSLKSNKITIEKISRGKFIKIYDEDQDLLDDVLIEIRQAIEMTEIYSGILSGTMDAFASIISNNLNIVMKVLTSITILLAVPTMIASFYGMNVDNLPFTNFWFPVSISAGLLGICAFILKKKDLL